MNNIISEIPLYFQVLAYLIGGASVLSAVLPKGSGTVIGNILNIIHAIALNFCKMEKGGI